MNTKEPKFSKQDSAKRHPPPIRPMSLYLMFPLLFMVYIVEGLFFVASDTVEANQVKLPTLNEEAKGIELYDRNDHFLCTVHSDKDRAPVPLSKVSLSLRNALVSTEDRRFFQHSGIDPLAMGRAFLANHKAGHVVEGASTITQQLVRNLYLDKNDRTYTRKINEVIMALNVDHHYSKAKILEAYLNEVYFGGGVYGVERAAQHFFNKHAFNLSIEESAFLVGLIKSPTILSDPQNTGPAISRQAVVLNNMKECGFITETEFEKAKLSKLAFQTGPHTLRYPHYITYALEMLKHELGSKMWTQGWRVYTNLDVNAQKLAERTLNNAIKTAPKGVDQAALVTMSLKDGAVLAMVGGAGTYADTQWNRALAPHTAGSVFKPFVYLTGLLQRVIEPDTLINDAPLEITAEHAESWKPKNFDGKFLGWIPARTALMFSRNVCAVRVAQAVGIDSVIRTAHSAGITSQLDAYPSLALGSCALTPFELTNAYATLARGGVYTAPQMIRTIRYQNGRDFKTFQFTPSANFQTEESLQLVDVLQDVVRAGTGTRAALPGLAVAGKTGTADSSKDLWFIGFTPDTVTTVWGGNDLNHPILDKHATGGTVMAKIWHDYMSGFYKDHKAPTGETFLAAQHNLIKNVPSYSDEYLMAKADTVTGPDSDSGISPEPIKPSVWESSITKVDSSFAGTPVSKSIKESGIATTFQLEKIGATQRYGQAVLRDAAAKQAMLANSSQNPSITTKQAPTDSASQIYETDSRISVIDKPSY